jgi:hypothetical protein
MNQVMSAHLNVSAKLIYLAKLKGLCKASVGLVFRQILVKSVVWIASLSVGSDTSNFNSLVLGFGLYNLYSSPNNITIKFRRKRLSGMQRPWGK